jgi:hypothetical protein
VQNLTAQKVCLALITLGFFIAAPWLTSQTIGGNTTPLLALLGVLFVFGFIFIVRDRCWMLIPLTLPIEGNLNFLPLNFSIQELSIIAVFAYLLYRMIFGMNIAWRLGPTSIWVPLALLLCIIVYHWIESRDIGIRLLGGHGWGGRKYFTVILAAFGMVLLSSFPGIKWADLQKIPFLYFLGSFVDIVPGAISTLVPATAPYIYKVYSGVNIYEYGALLQGNFGAESGVTRISQLASLGTGIGLVTLCYFPPKTWLQLNRLWALPVVLLGGVLCAASGFRNTVVRYFFSILVALFTRIRFKAFLLLPVVIATGFLIALTQGSVFDYPLALQRGLSFLPGQWNAKAVKEADASSEWREKMKKLFYKEYFHTAPWFGLGYHYSSELAKRDQDAYLAIAARQAEIGDEYADVRRFIEQRQPHEGMVHALLVSGSIGAFFFAAFCLAILLATWRSVVNTPRVQISPIQTWCSVQLFTFTIAFYLLGGDYTNFLIQVCPVTALLYQAETLRRAKLKTGPSLDPVLTPYPLAPRPSQS